MSWRRRSEAGGGDRTATASGRSRGRCMGAAFVAVAMSARSIGRSVLIFAEDRLGGLFLRASQASGPKFGPDRLGLCLASQCCQRFGAPLIALGSARPPLPDLRPAFG